MLLFNMEKEKLDRIAKMMRFFFSLSQQKQKQSLCPSATANQEHLH